MFFVNWKKHKWQQYWITSKLTILVCLLKELLGFIHPFNPFSTCICMLWPTFLTFLPHVGTCAHSGYSLPPLRMWFHRLKFPKFWLCLFAIVSSYCFTSELHKTKILLSCFYLTHPPFPIWHLVQFPVAYCERHFC